MFRTYVPMTELLRFLPREREHFLYARRVRDVAHHLRLRSGTDLLLHFHPYRLEIEAHLLQDVHGHALTQFDQAEKQVLGAHVVVVESVGFLASKRQNLLSSRCEIIHYSMVRSSSRCPTPLPSY